MTLPQVLKFIEKSDTMRSAKLCPCTPCRNRVRHVIYDLMGYDVKGGQPQTASITSKPDTSGIDADVVVAVELAVDDLMPRGDNEPDRRPLLKMPPPTTLTIGSGYPKGGKPK